MEGASSSMRPDSVWDKRYTGDLVTFGGRKRREIRGIDQPDRWLAHRCLHLRSTEGWSTGVDMTRQKMRHK